MIRQFMQCLLPLLVASLLVIRPNVEAQAAPLAQTQSATVYQGVVTTTANIRSGPGLNFSVVGQAQSGQSVTVVACNQDCSWLQLENGNWIAAFLVDLVASSPSTGSTSSRTRSGLLDPDDLELSPPSDSALEIVEQILAYVGLPQNFDVYSANIYNAAALMANGERVILYDPQLILDIENITNHEWPAVSILAHEIGHHLAGHTLGGNNNRIIELEADYFSGFILQKMGATLDEAQAVMNLLRDHPNMTDHPPQAERLLAIEEGWLEAARQSDVATWEPQFSAMTEDAWRANSPIANMQQAQKQRALDEVQALLLDDLSVGLRAFASQ
jgi:hypothetical protein